MRVFLQDFLSHLEESTPAAPPIPDEPVSADEKAAAAGSGGYKQQASAFVRGARHLISKHQRKARFIDESFDLDLTYITDRIIAMSFPATGIEATYRNKLEDVAAMLKEKHGDNFLIINCAEKSYETDNLCNQVLDFGWPDHMAAPLERLISAVQAMDSWNQSDPSNVVVVHCKGGKGRTGLVIAAYMLMARIFEDPDLAMEHFAVKRFESTDRTKTGITQYSQRRYCYYFKDVIDNKLKVRQRKLFLSNLVISKVPNFDGKGGCKPVVKLYEFPSGSTQAKQFFQYPPDGVKGDDHRFTEESGSVVIPLNRLMEMSDLLVEVSHRHQSSFKKEELQPIFRCQFNSMAMTGANAESVTFTKAELDDTKPKDTRFPDDATVTFNFDLKRTPPDTSTDNFGEMICHKYQSQKWNIEASAAALFDNIRSAPEVLSKDDKKGRKALKEKVHTVQSEYKASEMKMTEAQRLEVMLMVSGGSLSIEEAMAKILETEASLHSASGGGGGAVAAAATTPHPTPETFPSTPTPTPTRPPQPTRHSDTPPPPPDSGKIRVPKEPKPPNPQTPEGGEKRKPPGRPSRRPSVKELRIAGSVAAPLPPAHVTSPTASQVANPFGAPGGPLPTSTLPTINISSTPLSANPQRRHSHQDTSTDHQSLTNPFPASAPTSPAIRPTSTNPFL